MIVVLIIVYAGLFGGTCAVIAGSKGRDPANWFGLGLIFGIFALIAVCAMPAVARQVPDQPQSGYESDARRSERMARDRDRALTMEEVAESQQRRRERQRERAVVETMLAQGPSLEERRAWARLRGDQT